MLMNGIPSFRLEKDVVDAEIDILRELGVEFRCGVEVGKDVTIAQLREQGYLTGEKLEGGSTAYSFTNGLLFTITPEETQDNGASVCFSAGKWRSPLGAYYFTKCTASRGDNGWEYTVGAEAIS